MQKTPSIPLLKSLTIISSIKDCSNVVVSIQDELAGAAVTPDPFIEPTSAPGNI